MNDADLAALAAAGVALVLQVLKDHLNLEKPALRWVAALVGALVGGAAGWAGGGQSVSELATNAGVAALVTNGLHALILKDQRVGEALKVVGSLLFGQRLPKPPNPGG